MTYANGAAQTLSYDLAGNVVAETDAEGNAKQYQYDNVNRLIAVVDELDGKTTYTYDALDNGISFLFGYLFIRPIKRCLL